MNRTPLFDAVESGSIEAVDILLTNGARTDILDKVIYLHKILKTLLCIPYCMCCSLLIKADMTELSFLFLKDGETLLHFAGKSGKVEMLEFWIRRDYDVNALDKVIVPMCHSL